MGAPRRSLGRRLDSTDLQRKLAAGKGQLAQSTVSPLRMSEWASLHLHPAVMAEPDRQRRTFLSLLMAGHPDATKDEVCPFPAPSSRDV